MNYANLPATETPLASIESPTPLNESSSVDKSSAPHEEPIS